MGNQLRKHLEESSIPQSIIEEVTSMFANEAGRVLSLLEKYDSKTQEVITAAIHKYYLSMGMNSEKKSKYAFSVSSEGILGTIRNLEEEAANEVGNY